MPSVSVIIPVGPRGREFLGECLESLLSQSLMPSEILLIDDSPAKDLAGFISPAHRALVRVVKNRRTPGVAGALNTGLDEAAGGFIARMDADDRSRPDRFASQADYLVRHPETGLVASYVRRFGVREEVWKPPASHDELDFRLLFENPIVHPSVMIRSDVLQKNAVRYSESPVTAHAEDYDLWMRLVRIVRMAVIPTVLLEYRTHAGQVNQAHASAQQESTDRLRAAALAAWGIQATEGEIRIHNQIGSRQFQVSGAFLEQAEHWLLKMCSCARENSRYSAAAAEKVCGSFWFDLCRFAGKVPGTYGRWSASPLRRMPSPASYARFAAKALLGRFL